MKSYMNLMTDSPEQHNTYKSVSYSVFGLVLLPLFLSFCNIGFGADNNWAHWVDLAYHFVNFAAAVIIYFTYLKDSFWNVRADVKHFFKVTAIGAAVMMAVAVFFWYNALRFGNGILAFGVLPLTELDMLCLSGYVVCSSPVLGSICMVLLAPFAISCLFYGTWFASLCNSRPWAAYGVMALILAAPRIISALTFWYWQEELVLYLIQLPIHLIACRVYQKTDTIWGPILALMAVNLLSCVLMALL